MGRIVVKRKRFERRKIIASFDSINLNSSKATSKFELSISMAQL